MPDLFNDLRFAATERWWILAAPLVAWSAWSGLNRWRSAARRRWADEKMAKRFFGANVNRGFSREVAVLLAISLLAIALFDPRGGTTPREVQQRGVEVMFLLDVSRSMLAEDAKPNRLRRAKKMMSDLVDAMVGDRFGLTVFAGEVKRVVPLTKHRDGWQRQLDDLTPDTLLRGGSQIGDAIRIAATGLVPDDDATPRTSAAKAIVLLTDGEALDEDPVSAARTAYGETGVRVFTIAIGDFDDGAGIPVGKSAGRGYLSYRGTPVLSKPDAETLRRIAESAGGAFIAAGTKRVDMNDFYDRYLATMPAADFGLATFQSARPLFRWLVIPAVALMAYGLVGRRDNA